MWDGENTPPHSLLLRRYYLRSAPWETCPHYYGPSLGISAQAEGCFWLKRVFVKGRHICCPSIATHRTATCFSCYKKKIRPLSTFLHLSGCSCISTPHGSCYSLLAHCAYQGFQWVQINQCFFLPEFGDTQTNQVNIVPAPNAYTHNVVPSFVVKPLCLWYLNLKSSVLCLQPHQHPLAGQ